VKAVVTFFLSIMLDKEGEAVRLHMNLRLRRKQAAQVRGYIPV
jgi:hypothetical protein